MHLAPKHLINNLLRIFHVNLKTFLAFGAKSFVTMKLPVLTFASFFSGLEIPGFSFLDACKDLDVEGQISACVEVGDKQRTILRHMHPDAELHGDLRDLMIDALIPDPSGFAPTASLAAISKSKVLWVSSPREQKSTEGTSEGCDVGSGRLLLTSAKLIVNLKEGPEMLFYEQVSNIRSKIHIDFWLKLVGILKSKYKYVDWRVMAACDHGCPQRWRKRVFLVATNKDGWTWPEESPWTGNLKDLLDPAEPGDDFKKLPEKTKDNRSRKLVKQALKSTMTMAEKKSKQGQDSKKTKKLYLKNVKNLVVDTGCSERYGRSTLGYFPTLTRTRCQAFQYWICAKGKPISLGEIFRAFAVPDELAALYKEAASTTKVTDGQLAGMLGNSVAYSVAKKLLKRGLELIKS